ncbi:ABC transporter permease [Paracoccaceae bacterium GXU_MW_L88]
MFYAERPKTLLSAFMSMCEVVYHTAIRHIRRDGGHPVIGLLSQMGQTIMLMVVFFVFYWLIGRDVPLRGDMAVFLTTGIFLFMLHNKAMRAVIKSGSTTSKMNLHAPMNFLVEIAAASLSIIYLQILAFAIIAFACNVIFGGFPLAHPSRLIVPFLLAWGTGLAFGFIILAFKPLAPRLFDIIAQVHMRANMFTSGKMIPANMIAMIPKFSLSYFLWNPLFHVIDQARGAAFENYFPRYTNLEYPFYFTLFGIGFGIIAVRWADRNMSASQAS